MLSLGPKPLFMRRHQAVLTVFLTPPSCVRLQIHASSARKFASGDARDVHLSISLLSGQPLNFQMKAGETVFVLGANGTGKSSLMHRFFAAIVRRAARYWRIDRHGSNCNAIQVTGLTEAGSGKPLQELGCRPNFAMARSVLLALRQSRDL